MSPMKWQARIALALVSMAASSTAFALSKDEMKAIDKAVKNPSPLALWAVHQEFQGNVQDMDRFLAEFTKNFDGQGLGETLTGFDTSSVMVVYADPDRNQQIRMAVGLTTPGRLAVKAPLQSTQIQFPDVVNHTHVGPYQELGQVHAEVIAALQKDKSPQRPVFPVIVRLINDPKLVKADAIRSQMWIPLDQPGGPPLDNKEINAIEKAVKNAGPVAHDLVVESFKGSPADIGAFLQRFQAEFTRQGLDGSLANGPATAPVALIYSDPDQGQAVQIDVGFPVNPGARPVPPLMALRYDQKRAAVHLHEGEYRQLSQVFAAANREANKKKMKAGFPVALRLLTDPRKAQTPTDIKTEMIIPIN